MKKVDIAATAHAQLYSLFPVSKGYSVVYINIDPLHGKTDHKKFCKTTYWGLMLITINKEPKLKCQRIMIS